MADILGMIGQGLGLFGDMANMGMQYQGMQYQKEVQKKTWEREDNAVQRRAADLQAAGINPLLAAGSAAASSTPIQVGVPQADLSNAQGMSTMLRQGKENALTQSQKDLIDQQYWREAEIYKSKVEEAKANAKLASTKADEEAYNLGVWKSRGLPTNQGGMAANASGFWDWGKNFLPQYWKDTSGAVAGPAKQVYDKAKAAAEKIEESFRLKKEKAYQDAVRSGKVSLQGGR